MGPIDEWLPAIGGEFSKDYYKKLGRIVYYEYETQTVYPAKEQTLGGSASFLRYWDYSRTVLFLDARKTMPIKYPAKEIAVEM